MPNVCKPQTRKGTAYGHGRGSDHGNREEVAVVTVAIICVGQNVAMISSFSILPFLLYVPLIALLVIGIWVGILGIRALNKYLRAPTTEMKQPH